jgi:integrase
VTVGIEPGTGKQVRRTVYGWTKAEVVEGVREIRDQVARAVGEPEAQAPDMPLAEYLRQWLNEQRGQIVPGTLRNYEKHVKHLCGVSEGLTLEGLTGVQASSLLRRLAEGGISSVVQYQCGIRLRQALKRAFLLGLTDRDVGPLVELPRYRPKDQHPFNEAQVGKLLLSTVGTRWHGLLYTALDTGARAGELTALEWTDLEGGRIWITKTFPDEGSIYTQQSRQTKTRAGRRVLSIGKGCLDALAAHRQMMDAEGHGSRLMFPGRAGWPIRETLSDEWPDILKRAGLPRIRFHDLRHTTATLLLKAGIGVHEVAQRLGHSNPKEVLRTYGHVLPSMAERTSRAIDSVLRSSTNSSRLPCGLKELPA